jgi:hypothetical protein
MSPDSFLASGTLLGGKYRIEHVLGQGGMGAVYLAENVDIGRKVAVKVLLPRIATDPEVVIRFRNEARAAASIHHPCIVEMIDTGQGPSGEAFLVMEHLKGESLGARVRRAGPLDINSAVWIATQVLDGIDAAHQQGIVHRDLKPDNVFLVEGDRLGVKILDFGISKFHHEAEPSLTSTSTVLGTPAYMAPEQARHAKDAGPPADIYAVGAILYETLAGVPVFEGRSYNDIVAKVLTEAHRPIREVRPEVPEGLARVIDAMLSKSPQARPASAREATAILNQALLDTETGAATHGLTLLSVPPRGPRRLGPALVVTALAVVAGAVAAWVRWSPWPSPDLAPAVVPATLLAGSDAAPAASLDASLEPAPPDSSRPVPLRLVVLAPAARIVTDDDPTPCKSPCLIARPPGTKLQLEASAPGHLSARVEVIFDSARDQTIRLSRIGGALPIPVAEAPRKPGPDAGPPVPREIDEDNPYRQRTP